MKQQRYLSSKNKSDNLSDSNNYRPIALATIVSRMPES